MLPPQAHMNSAHGARQLLAADRDPKSQVFTETMPNMLTANQNKCMSKSQQFMADQQHLKATPLARSLAQKVALPPGKDQMELATDLSTESLSRSARVSHHSIRPVLQPTNGAELPVNFSTKSEGQRSRSNSMERSQITPEGQGQSSRSSSIERSQITDGGNMQSSRPSSVEKPQDSFVGQGSSGSIERSQVTPGGQGSSSVERLQITSTNSTPQGPLLLMPPAAHGKAAVPQVSYNSAIL